MNNPRWLLLVSTLPLLFLFSLEITQYNIIKTLLKEEHSSLWLGFSAFLALMGIATLVYALVSMRFRVTVSPVFHGISFFSYSVYLYLYCYNYQGIMPFYIPNWMFFGEMLIYVGTFLMPILAYNFFGLLSYSVPESGVKAWHNFLIALAIPILWYGVSMIILPMRREADPGVHFLFFLVLSGTLIFLFFLARGFYIIAQQKSEFWATYSLVITFIVGIVFPLVGLTVNMGWGMRNVFGDFSHPFFFILAFINGCLLFIPQTSITSNKQHLVLFAARSICFSYTFYFFIVFLPYLPFSVFAILSFGAGFLMLSPLALFIIHTQTLLNDIKNLTTIFSKKMIWATLIIGFLLFPAIIFANYAHQKTVLNEALAYLYAPDYSKTYNLDESALKKTLDNVKINKDRNQWNGLTTPYLSAFYNWLVLDNLTLSDSKIERIEKIFSSENANKDNANAANNNALIALPNMPNNNDKNSVIPSLITSESRFDSTENAWKTWVNMEITNTGELDNREFETEFALPTGCWISNYYLYLGDKKEMGILAEKKAAMWVYQNIREENHDPGILRYISGNKIGFNVFPFGRGETRKTGFELLHKEPINFEICGKKLFLGDSSTQKTLTKTSVNNRFFYVSAKQKSALPLLKRRPYYHFIIDISAKNNPQDAKKQSIATLEKILKNTKNAPAANLEAAQISFVNSSVKTISLREDWKKEWAQQTYKNGFFAEFAMKKALVEAYNTPKQSYPVFVLISDDISKGIFPNDFSDLEMTFPEGNIFYSATNDLGSLEVHSLQKTAQNSFAKTDSIATAAGVLAYPNAENPIAFLPNNKQGDIVIKNENADASSTQLGEKTWLAGLSLEGSNKAQILNPANTNKNWLELVKSSFTAKILTHETAFIVLENEAQKAAMLQKQSEILAGNKHLDASENAQKMDEPNVWLLLVLLAIFIYWKKIKEKYLAFQKKL